jgi:hypothetical protein
MVLHEDFEFSLFLSVTYFNNLFISKKFYLNDNFFVILKTVLRNILNSQDNYARAVNLSMF